MKKITKVGLALATIGAIGFVVYKGVKAIVEECDHLGDCTGCPYENKKCDYDCENCPCSECFCDCTGDREFTEEECGCCDYEENCCDDNCSCGCHNGENQEELFQETPVEEVSQNDVQADPATEEKVTEKTATEKQKRTKAKKVEEKIKE